MLKFINRRRQKHLRKLEDIYASNVFVQPLLRYFEVPIAFNQYALRPFSIAMIANDILFNRRLHYIEFGGGISTLLIAKFIQLNQLKTRITVIDHDLSWLEMLTGWLEKEGLMDIVDLHYAELVETETPMGRSQWYDHQKVLSAVGRAKIDIVLVDGPPGKGRVHRYNALPVLAENGNLSEEFSIYLDDAARKPEKAIIKDWSTRYNLEFKTWYDQLAVASKGQSLAVALSN
jgi:16S rRNA G966 N2-methylase RsmD